MIANWKEYEGTDEQIGEIKNTKNGYVLRKSNGQEIAFLSIEHNPNLENVTHYWIIPDDPLREMKIRQSQTGQPVWIKGDVSFMQHLLHTGNEIVPYPEFVIIKTNTPDWNIPNAEYSFMPFEEDDTPHQDKEIKCPH